jgi:Flp pilus assembly protein TadD
MEPVIESLYATGHWLLEQSRFDDAASVFRVMTLAAPDDERSWLGLGTCHEKVGQVRVAEKLYGAGVTLAREPVRCLAAQALALRALGLDDASEEVFERAAELAASDELSELVRAARRAQ